MTYSVGLSKSSSNIFTFSNSYSFKYLILFKYVALLDWIHVEGCSFLKTSISFIAHIHRIFRLVWCQLEASHLLVVIVMTVKIYPSMRQYFLIHDYQHHLNLHWAFLCILMSSIWILPVHFKYFRLMDHSIIIYEIKGDHGYTQDTKVLCIPLM